ncbi:phage tail sheath C-terminal domain-containing protein [Enterobacter sp. ECC-175]|uniref:phage tail sheath C-terminal domain-containing protein n=1 Tax=Enterobacter sp. ECC-175 TaxID=3116479 RepID=UPI003754CC6C
MSYYPGVHIFEKTKISLANAGMSGLKPLLVGRFLNKDGTPRSLSDGLLHIDNWHDFEAVCLSSPLFLKLEMKEKETTLPISSDLLSKSFVRSDGIDIQEGEDEDEDEDEGEQPLPEIIVPPIIAFQKENLNTGSIALSHYFSNGGGACYLLSLGEDDVPAQIKDALFEYDDISLMAVIDSEYDSTEAINTVLDSTITDNLQSFLVTRHALLPYGDDTALSRINRTRTATYAPDLLLSSLPRIYDDGYLVEWEKDQYRSLASLENGSNEEKTVFKMVNKALNSTHFLYENVDDDGSRTLSPCAAVVGCYCRTERMAGIWKAPANVSIIGATPVTAIGKLKHTQLNDSHINAILWNPRYNTVIMGARTQEDPNKPAWRYVPVRLLFNTVERDVRKMLRPMLFEPNSASTRQIVTSAINNYLHMLWKKGGLYGSSPEEAFSVAIALQDNDANNGILRVKIGMATLRPVEFIFLEFTQDMLLPA